MFKTLWYFYKSVFICFIQAKYGYIPVYKLLGHVFRIFTIFDLFSALATLIEEYVKAANSPGAVPVVQNAWDVFTTTKCTKTMNDAKAVYE